MVNFESRGDPQTFDAELQTALKHRLEVVDKVVVVSAVPSEHSCCLRRYDSISQSHQQRINLFHPQLYANLVLSVFDVKQCGILWPHVVQLEVGALELNHVDPVCVPRLLLYLQLQSVLGELMLVKRLHSALRHQDWLRCGVAHEFHAGLLGLRLLLGA